MRFLMMIAASCLGAVAAAPGGTLAQTPMPSSSGDAERAGAGTASATLKTPEGAQVGRATLTQTPHGVLLHVELHDLPAGPHAFHIHETGACEPTFEAAGGHYAPEEHAHGYLMEEGYHAGDMPNIFVPESGDLTFEVLNRHVALDPEASNTLFDSDGSALIVHSGPDDYKSQPSGDAGDRIACGVIERVT